MKRGTIGALIATIPVQNTLGEGAIWDGQSDCIWWTDIENAHIFQYQLLTQKLVTHEMPMRVGCFALTEREGQLIVAFDIGIAHYHYHTKQLTWIATPEKHLLNHRFNDGRVDRQGRFWAGTMVEDITSSVLPRTLHQGIKRYGKNAEPLGALYCVDSHNHTLQVLDGIGISNSLCWSPDSKILYHADSTQRQIIQYNFDPSSAKLSQPRLFANTPIGIFPDGAEVDAEGYVWVALWGGGSVVRFSPDGEIDLTLPLPVSNPTSVAFGGPHLDWLIITSARHSLSQTILANEPLAGNVFIYQLNDVHGLASPRFNGV